MQKDNYLTILNLSSIKKTIKSEPRAILRKPWILLAIPFILIDILRKRLRSSNSVVYLTETKLAEVIVKPHEPFLPNRFRVIRSLVEFSKFSEAHVAENPGSAEYYRLDTRQRFERGDFAIVFLDELNEPLSYLFIATRKAVFAQVGITLPLPEGIFGMYDVYTYQVARGKGYYSQLFWYSIHYLDEQGYEGIWLWLMAHNKVSVTVHYKLGITHITKILTKTVAMGRSRKEVKDVDMNLELLLTS